MSSVQKTIPESSADIGGLKVGRLLPSRIQRSIGPFVFMDHFGPENLSAETNLDVPHF